MYTENDYKTELYHHGILGQKWGVRRYQNKDGSLTADGKKRYNSTNIKSYLAKKENEKIDKSFQKWKEEDAKRDIAIELGKKANIAKLAYEKDKSNEEAKSAYKQAEKDYKKALNQNTTYRKGVVKKEVKQDSARKYLSEAKKVKKQLDNDPTNKELQKSYNDLMSKHDIDRADARKAVDRSREQSSKEASIKRSITMTVKAVATTTAVAIGIAAVNTYLKNNNMTINDLKLND